MTGTIRSLVSISERISLKPVSPSVSALSESIMLKRSFFSSEAGVGSSSSGAGSSSCSSSPSSETTGISGSMYSSGLSQSSSRALLSGSAGCSSSPDTMAEMGFGTIVAGPLLIISS